MKKLKNAFADSDFEALISPARVAKRWNGCHPKTARNRLVSAGYEPIRFNGRVTLFRLADVRAYEHAAGMRTSGEVA